MSARGARSEVVPERAVLVIAAVAAFGHLVLGWVGFLVPEEAMSAAVGQYETSSGMSAQVVVAIGWSDCAVVTVSPRNGAVGGATYAMIKNGGRWELGRAAGDDAGFDQDDLTMDHGGCLDVARSTGPLVNGGPVDP